MVKKEHLSHVNAKGDPTMVDVSSKVPTRRSAWARSKVIMTDAIVAQIKNNDIHTKKGPVFHTAIIAGVMGAKKTSELIPFCHPLSLEDCAIEITREDKSIIIDCRVITTGKTGVEMEAMTGASVAALTLYDMCKALSHDIRLQETLLMEKKGGKRDFRR